MIDMANGETVATAAVGREGAVGILSVLGPTPSDFTVIVRARVTASRIAASRFHAAFNRSPAIRHVVQIHVRAIVKQFQLGAACNALHPVEARMASWLPISATAPTMLSCHSLRRLCRKFSACDERR
jgi:hypothetical protein